MKKSFKVLLTALILAGEVLLQSCENFLEGGNFSEQINQNIAYAKANELSILLKPEEGTGSTIPAAGIINLKQGYPFEIEFDAGKEYHFVEWKAVSRENPLIRITEGVVFDNPKSLKTKVTVNIDSLYISIVPVCSPVTKISAIEPLFKDEGVRCDYPVTITFNNPVKKDCLIQDNPDNNDEPLIKNIQIVDLINEAQHYEQYFKITVSESGDSFTLTPTKEIKNLVPGKTDTKDFKIKLDYEKIEDGKGFTVQTHADIVHRINGYQEKNPPVIKQLELYKYSFIKDEWNNVEESAIDVPLLDTAVNEETLVPADYRYDIFSVNHVKDKVWVSFEADDEGSGYKKLTIKETLLRTSDETVVNLFSGSTEILWNKYELYSYMLSSKYDGLVRLDFIFEDRAGNTAARSFYVIKDTSIDSNKVFIRQFIYVQDRISHDGKISEKFDYTGRSDNFFGYQADFCTYSLCWGESDERYMDPVKPSEDNDCAFEFERNIHYDCYVKIKAVDSVGNRTEIIRCIPVQPEILGLSDDPLDGNKINKKVIALDADYDDNSWYKNCISAPYILWRFKPDENSEFGEYYLREISQPVTNLEYGTGAVFQVAESTDAPGDGIYEIYMMNVLNYVEKNYYGPLSKPYIYYHNYTPSNPVTDNVLPAFPDSFNVSIGRVEKNASVRYIQVSLPSDFEATEGFEYGVYCTELQKNCRFTFNLNSGRSYTLKLYAKSTNTNIVYYSECTAAVECPEDNIPPELIDEFYVSPVCSPNKVFPFFYDANVISNSQGMYYNENKQAYEVEYYLYKKEDNKNYQPAVISGYDFKSISIDGKEIQNISSKIITAHLKLPKDYYNYVQKDISGGFYGYKTTLDFGDNFLESYYTLILNLKDKNNNNKLYALAVSNITYPVIPILSEFEYTEYEGELAYIFHTGFTGEKDLASISFCFLTQDDYWIRDDKHREGLFRKGSNGGNITISLKDDNALHLQDFKKDSFICLGITSREDYNCFHSLYKYFYPAYELKTSQEKAQVCNTKAVIPGLAGAYQVYYDSPCFAHTMIFPTNMLNEIDAKVTEALSIDSKLTEEEARCAVWETKGRELGVKLINNTWLSQTENAIYTAPLSEIESGYSYVTVFHFADGTAVMSDVKQK